MKGLSHITFIVRNLDRMAAFLCEGLGAREVYDSSSQSFSLSREKFFVLGDIWLAAMEGEPPIERSYQHVAFAVAEPDLPMYQVNLQALGVEIRPPRSRVEGEGLSLYFYDFDNHLFELHTGTLEQRLSRYRAERKLCAQADRAGRTFLCNHTVRPARPLSLGVRPCLMMHLEIRDTAILVGYNPEGMCVYSSSVPLDLYWDGSHVWDTDTDVKKLRLEKVKGYLFGSSGELLKEFESIFNPATGVYSSGWAKHSDGTLREDKA